MNDLKEVATLTRALSSGKHLTSEQVLSVIALLTLSPAWPPALRVLYSDPGARPPAWAKLPRTPNTAPTREPVVHIERLQDGGLRVGREFMPRDLRTVIPPSEWAPFDALLTGVRLFQYDAALTALRCLIATTGLAPESLQRQTDAQGLPMGSYLPVLKALRKKSLHLLEDMTRVSMDRLITHHTRKDAAHP